MSHRKGRKGRRSGKAQQTPRIIVDIFVAVIIAYAVVAYYWLR